MSAVLRVVAARFVRDGIDLMTPFSLELPGGTYATLVQPNAHAAAIAARVAAAIVKPTFGVVHVGDFDTRLQPAQAKRTVGFVPSCGFLGGRDDFRREACFRADVWRVDRAATLHEAEYLLHRFDARFDGELEEGYARAVALALAPGVKLAVLELPPRNARASIAALQPSLAIAVATVASESPAELIARSEAAR